MTTATPVAPAPEKTATLTAVDRCDQCGAQAYFEVSITLEDGRDSDMLFCAHHFHRGEIKLRSIATAIKDESWRLGE